MAKNLPKVRNFLEGLNILRLSIGLEPVDSVEDAVRNTPRAERRRIRRKRGAK